jgi:cellulose synthase/poly-beta-1,6-N-acetylglucosamine synthase-like glycosyltransferase/peptidoglycan/xylan/chitin deacetylase (PgdA/CDA1 family)
VRQPSEADARQRAARLRRRLWRPPAHWRLLAFCLAVVLVLIAFEGFTTHQIGASSESHGSGVAAPLANGGAILRARGSSLVSIQRPAGPRVALTFDDGPDPRWTPQIAAVLRAEGVPATFFVIGSEAQRHSGIVRRLTRDGFEIANHTFTHAELSALPSWERAAQLELTEATIVAITGHYARFMRPPYSATPDAVTPEQERTLAQAAGERYIVVLANFDSGDWRRRGVASIVANATPLHGSGGIVMLHDGGGDRSETVAAVKQLIPLLRAQGFRFVTLADLAGLSRAAIDPGASSWQRLRAKAFGLSVRLGFLLVAALTAIVVAIGVLVLLRLLAVVALASHHTRTTRRRPVPDDDYRPSVSVIVPAYNEAVGIERSVRSLADSDYGELEIIVVDDGSTDETAAIVAGLGLPGLRLVRQHNAGKAAALNTGVRFSHGEVLVMVDGDTLFERDTIHQLVLPLADPAVAAVSGNTKVGNRRGLLGKWQHIEYVMGFNLDRRMYEVLQFTPTVPGAIGAFRRSALEQVGGVPSDTLAEDTDLTLAIGRTGKRVVYAEYARAWTEAPSTLGSLWRQRYRWSFGTMQAIWKHRGAFVSRDPRQRRIGRRALPYILLFQIALPLAAPLIDLFAIYGVLFLNPLPVLAYWLVFNGVQVAVAIFAFRLDREPLAPLWAMPLQQFVYRQLVYLVAIESTVSAFMGVRARWQHIPRTGTAEIAGGRAS